MRGYKVRVVPVDILSGQRVSTAPQLPINHKCHFFTAVRLLVRTINRKLGRVSNVRRQVTIKTSYQGKQY